MKTQAYVGSIALLIAATLLAIGLTGCETESAASAIHITPSTAQIKQGQTITLTASGGYHYTWSIQNPTWGILSSTEGASVTYTSLLQLESTTDTNTLVTTTPAPQVQIVQVVSTIPGDSASTSSQTSLTPGGTNTTITTTATAGTATAQIYHIPN